MFVMMQATYGSLTFPIRGNAGFDLGWIAAPRNGTARAADVVPNTVITLSPGEILIAANGSSDGTRLTSFSLKTSSGIIYGPFGNPNSGTGWVSIGSIYSFYGGVSTAAGLRTLSSIGFYTDPPSPPPLPPVSPSPPPSPPRGPAPPPAWKFGRVKTPTVGFVGDYFWDDGGRFSGKPFSTAGPATPSMSRCNLVSHRGPTCCLLHPWRGRQAPLACQSS